MRQGLGLVALQIVSIILGFVTVFYVASGIEPEVYSLVGIYAVISTFLVSLSLLGIESAAIRNILYWENTGRIARIKRYISTAILSRLIMYLLLLPLVFGYSYYMSESKFDGQHFDLFLLFAFVSFFSVINMSIRLSLVAFNKYLLAALPDFFVNIFGRLIALYVFTVYGFQSFILVLVSLPFLTSLFLVFLIKNWVSPQYLLSIKSLKIIAKRNKSLAGANVVQFGFNSADQLLISLFVAPEIFATFSLAKQVEQIGKKFIENVFDPLVQRLVKYKANAEQLYQAKNKVKKIHFWCCAGALSSGLLAIYLVDYGVSFLEIDKYPFINYYFYFAIISSILYLINKFDYDIIALFSPIKQVFKMEIFRTVTFICVFLIFLNFIDQQYLYLYRSLAFITLYIYLRNLLTNETKKNINSDV